MINPKQLFLAITCLLCLNTGFSADENLFNGLVLSNISPTSKIVVRDAWYPQYIADTDEEFFSTQFAVAKVKLWFDDSERKLYSAAWNVEVTYKIDLTTQDGTVVTHEDQTLSIDFDQTGAYKDIELKIYDDAADFYIKAVVYDISYTVSGMVVKPTDIHLDVELNARRYYNLDADEMAENVRHTGVQTLANGNQTEVLWDYVEGAESYDFEWLFIDEPEAELASLGGEYTFKNATRVNVLTTNYKISLAYPRGVFVFRVRGVGKKVVDGKVVRVEGKWSTNTLVDDLTALPSDIKLPYDGLMSGMNWQYQATFAEEGKKGEVMGIYDGSLKPRQNIATNNSDGTVVVNEVIYDYLGRPAISLLPVPQANTGVGFYPGRTLNEVSGDYYDYQNFDVVVGAEDRINNPQSMAGLGINEYYSDGGSTIGMHSNFVADAGDYPFARTTFTKDGTGRVRTQTAIGDTKIGSKQLSGVAAQVTRFLYGTPTQEELYRLFGNEVGFASHYKKNAVIDQNGQAYLQVLDMSGRVIATCLAGDAPTNLLQIDSYPDEFDRITADLTVNNTFNEDGELLISKRIVVPYETTYDFEYSLADISYLDECMEDYPFDVKYDLLIYIEDENYDSLNLGVIPGDDDPAGYSYRRYAITENTPISFSVPLPIGEYTINKVLRINEDYLEVLKDEYYEYQSCFAFSPTTGTPCNETCEDLCFSGYGYINKDGNKVFKNEDGEEVFIETGVETYELLGGFSEGDRTAILDSIAACEALCEEGPKFLNDPCENKLRALMVDMSPGGQYFDNTPFREFSPLLGDINGWLEDPTNNVTILPSGIHPGATTWDEVRANWSDDYAMALVEFHPEYCLYLLHCGLGVNSPLDCPSGGLEIDLDPDLEIEEIVCYPNCPDELPDLLPVGEYNYLAFTTSVAYGTPDAYLFNPTNIPQNLGSDPATYQFGPNLTDDEQYDPYIACRFLLQDEIDTRLKEFIDVSGDGSGDFHTIWTVIDNIEGITAATPGAYPASVVEYYEVLHGVDALIGTGDGQMSKYQFFRSAYYFIKEQVEYNALETFEIASPSTCNGKEGRLISPTDDNYTAEGFLIHYPTMPAFEVDGGWMPEDYEALVDDACADGCEEYATAWLLELEGCAPTAMLGEARELLVAICAANCDEDNPYGLDGGATSVTGMINGTSYTVSSFDEVIDALNIENGENPDCPYISHPPTSPADLLANCVCDNITEFITNFYSDIEETMPALDASFSLSGLSAEDLDDLISRLEELLADEEDAVEITAAQIESWVIDCHNGDPLEDLISAFVCGELPEFDITDYEEDCGDYLDAIINYYDEISYRYLVEQGWLTYLAGYKQNAWENIATREVFTMAYDLHEYHYTLFYYDQAGNLIKTVPPAGIYRKPNNAELLHSSTLNTTRIQECKDHLENPVANEYVHPNHQLITNYKYNSLQQLMEQTTPDGGKTTYWYDALGRLIVSQNARQANEANHVYSYTIYDLLGRVTEAGEISHATPMDDVLAKNAFDYDAWITTGIRKEVMRTIYNGYAQSTDEILAEMGIEETDHAEILNLRGRIGSVVFQSDYNADIDIFDHASHYNYDYAGNVKTVIHENGILFEELDGLDAQDELQFVRTDYTYDLISGNVVQVDYQNHARDQFHYKYEYDANNRLTVSYSSHDGEIWEKESKNFYYAHGPLARQEIGDQIVQAADYVYTVNGWLKTVNSSVNDENPVTHVRNDAGKDGQTGHQNQNIGKDAVGFSLHYYENDYLAVNEAATDRLLVDYDGAGEFGSIAHDLYNGNISQMITSVNDINESGLGVLANKYRYDQLQRIKKSNVFEGYNIRVANSMLGATNGSHHYDTEYTFDGNGNILTLDRKDAGGALMDDFAYHYNYTIDPLDPDASVTTNQLTFIYDGASPTVSTTDVDEQEAGNYVYDALGQLIYDRSNDIEEIQWTVTGKVKKISYNDALNGDLETNIDFVEFEYDAMGNRVSKKVGNIYTDGGFTTIRGVTTYYMHDASGNVLATYEHNNSEILEPETMLLNEHHLYGSKRLGIANRSINMDNPIDYEESNLKHRILGEKSYELSNHLGNVLVTVSDRLLITTTDGTNVDFYDADVTSHTEYYPGGMMLPGRHATDGSQYRYGFNGFEADDEIKGEGNSYTTEFRQYDPRIFRWTSTDPVTHHHQSPYNAFDGNPILFADPSGADVDGDYYDRSGNYLGNDGIDDKRVYVVDDATNFSISDFQSGGQFFNNQSGFSITHKTDLTLLNGVTNSEFLTISNIIDHESRSDDATEMLWIAHTSNNKAKSKGKSLFSLLSSSYSSVSTSDKIPQGTSNTDAHIRSRAAVISVFMGDTDPTGGATYWDGTDFIAWGLNSPNGTPQNKIEEYDIIEINGAIFQQYLSAQVAVYGSSVRYSGVSYSIPDELFTSKVFWNTYDNWYSFSWQPTSIQFWNGVPTAINNTYFRYDSPYNSNGSTLKATGSFGGSIFWKVESGRRL